MIRAAIALALVVGLGGCTRPLKPDDIPPPLSSCAPACVEPCDTSLPLWSPPDPASAAAWDWIKPQVVSPLHEQVEACEQHRLACVECLRSLDRNGVIRWPQGN